MIDLYDAPSRTNQESIAQPLTAVLASKGALANDDLGRAVCAIMGQTFGNATISTGDDGSDEMNIYASGGKLVEGDYRHRMPDCDLSAAVSFFTSEFPGWWWLVRSDDAKGALANIGEEDPNMSGLCFPVYAATPALALLGSMLRAAQLRGLDSSLGTARLPNEITDADLYVECP